MRTINHAALLASALVITAVLVVTASAQERRPGGPGRDGMTRMNPLMTALDTNNDGVIDAQEIANASAALKKLDKNGDGKLTQDELRPALPGGERGERDRGPGAMNADQMIARLMEFDKNGDGKLSKDELPE